MLWSLCLRPHQTNLSRKFFMFVMSSKGHIQWQSNKERKQLTATMTIFSRLPSEPTAITEIGTNKFKLSSTTHNKQSSIKLQFKTRRRQRPHIIFERRNFFLVLLNDTIIIKVAYTFCCHHILMLLLAHYYKYKRTEHKKPPKWNPIFQRNEGRKKKTVMVSEHSTHPLQ